MKHKKTKSFLLALMSLFFISSPALATLGELEYGTALVDGNKSEWTSVDYYADMYRAGNTSFPVESRLNLRYDCEQMKLYAMVETVDDVQVMTDVNTDEHFIKIDDNKVVDAGYSSHVFRFLDPDSSVILPYRRPGWEASAPVSVGTHTLNVHTQVWDEESQTSAVADRSIPLVISCNPTSVVISDFTAEWQPVKRRVKIDWQTSSELEVVGFDVYRSDSRNGIYTKINSTFIPASAPGSVFGESYTYYDSVNFLPRFGYYYKLKISDIYGGANYLAPVLATDLVPVVIDPDPVFINPIVKPITPILPPVRY